MIFCYHDVALTLRFSTEFDRYNISYTLKEKSIFYVRSFIRWKTFFFSTQFGVYFFFFSLTVMSTRNSQNVFQVFLRFQSKGIGIRIDFVPI